MMDDFNSETDSDYTSYWRDWVSDLHILLGPSSVIYRHAAICGIESLTGGPAFLFTLSVFGVTRSFQDRGPTRGQPFAAPLEFGLGHPELHIISRILGSFLQHGIHSTLMANINSLSA